MSEKQFFILKDEPASDGSVVLSGSEFHHMTRVGRMNCGDTVYLLDGLGTTFKGVIMELRKDSALIDITERFREDEMPRFDIAIGVIKAQRMDMAVEKVTELGVSGIIPLISSRSVWKGDDVKKRQKRDRLERKVAAACKQSGRAFFPEVHPLTSFDSLIEMASRYDTVLLADDEGESPDIDIDLSHSVLGIVGPEGGFSESERDALLQAGAYTVWLSRKRLRTETASICLAFLVRRMTAVERK
ncbi:MAG: hypothetical protein B6D63_02030 [Candidatus Latescibacteria bacterium 4484_7]|nr:MAG: hypothetical protein B6D63_02030 [Candidatus Latescibacteria bacterium 4484_7]RKZ06187.1 MAG: hypothetical protein DRQ05_05180 [bacterium]